VDVQEPDRLLKRGAHRSVWRTLEDGRPAAVKCWDAGGPWRSLRARVSARREYALLGRLHSIGLPVPEPLALRARAGRPELVSAWIEGQDLRQRLLQGADPGLAARLGRGLARMHQVGLRHADLHAGNVLVDASGEPWMVDAGGARLGRALARAERQAALVMVCADLREHTSRSWRGRAWRAYLEVLGERESAGEARTIEALAQERRRAVIARAQRRWLRDSSSCTRLGGSQGPVLASRDLELAGREVLELRPRSSAHARSLWLAAVRLCDHGLPCAAPLLWFQGGKPRLYFYLPRFARAAVLEEVLAELERQLVDRGLELLRSSDLRAWRDERGQPWISGAEELRELGGRAPWRSR
jgi:tRNA A-37 threonylcarbamoyl transferase component Bud32